jgi:hypothetical protein
VNCFRDIAPLFPILGTFAYNRVANPNFTTLLLCLKSFTFTFLKMSHLSLLVETPFLLEILDIVLTISTMVDLVIMLPIMACTFFFSNFYYTQVVMSYNHSYSWHNEWVDGPTRFQNQALECNCAREHKMMTISKVLKNPKHIF